MKTVDIEQAVSSAVPLPVRKKMTRAEKLRHWAELVRNTRHPYLHIYHNLEHWNPEALNTPIFNVGGFSAFGIATADPVLREQGLKTSHAENGTANDVMGFFELSQNDLHEFSCDCGGQISNSQMADRIEGLAGRGGGGGSGTTAIDGTIVNGITRRPLFGGIFRR